MENFIHNKKWSKEEWDTYFNNIDMLRRKHNLNKSQFNTRIGVSNAFRMDRKRPSYEIIYKICKEFNIDEKWLSASHDTIDTKIQRSLTQEKIPSSINENSIQYENKLSDHLLENFCDIPKGLGFIEAVDMLAEIFRSGRDGLINAIKVNLYHFTQNVQFNQNVENLNIRVNELEKVITRRDRRSGTERRNLNLSDYNGKNQRRKDDRRNN